MIAKKPKPHTPWQADLLRAAEILEEYAGLLAESYTVNGRWPDTDGAHLRAHEDHDEYSALAKRLRKGAVG